MHKNNFSLIKSCRLTISKFLLFKASEVGALFTFLARQLGRPSSGLQVEKELFHKVFEYLTEPGGAHREERQQALLELLRAGGLQEYSKDTLLELASKAKL